MLGEVSQGFDPAPEVGQASHEGGEVLLLEQQQEALLLANHRGGARFAVKESEFACDT